MALLIDHNKLRELKDYAESHHFTLEELYAIRRGECPQAGDRPEHHILFPVGYKVVFSIDQTLDQKRWVRHMSMSVSTPGRVPNEFALREVCSHLGFKDFDKCLVQKSLFHPQVIEVLDYLDE